MSQNCDCSDTTGYRTLAQLRTDLFNRLGFVDPLANVATRTLVELRADIARRLGYAAQVAAGSYPPGQSDLIDGFINEAQQTLWRRLELDKGTASLPARMTVDANPTTLDYVPVFNLALALAKAHKGAPDAKVYFEIVEKYLSDVLNRRPPNASALCTGFLQDAQRILVRRPGAAGIRNDRWFSWSLVAGERFYDFDADDDAVIPPPTTDDVAVTRVHSGGILLDARCDFKFTWINAQGETSSSALFLKGSELTGDVLCSYRIDWTAPEIADCLSPITSLRVYVYSGGHWKLMFTKAVALGTWTYTGNEGVPVEDTTPPTTNTATAAPTDAKVFDPLNVKWVGATSGSQRYPLAEGIPPSLLNTSETGQPRYYRLAQCLEIWPAPADSTGTLEFRAGFKATRFTEDSDLPSVDDELLFLLALANAKAHFKRPDAQLVLQEFEVYLANLIAGSHGAQRYVPGRRSDACSTYSQPTPTVPFE